MRENMPYWADARDSHRPTAQTRRARVRMGLIHPTHQFSGRDARTDARKRCFDSSRKPQGGPTRGARHQRRVGADIDLGNTPIETSVQTASILVSMAEC